MKPAAPDPELDWERRWAPYDEPTYMAVLEAMASNDIVLEIGAGDCRLAKRLAKKAQKVYAVERNQELVTGLSTNLPANCQLITADARHFPFPQDISAAVLLMRHCRSFAQYWSKLVITGCEKLITNARWGLGVEIVDLKGPRLPFDKVSLGWYACCCGYTGFVTGAAERITERVVDRVWEVTSCPACPVRSQAPNLQ
jgi:hypothetical protein